jgi:hypothetical protein
MPSKRLEREGPIWQWELVWEARSLNFGEEDDPLWLVCVTCSSRDAFLTRKVFQTEPTASELWDVLLEAMQRPETGEPHPPMVLMVGANQGWEALKRQLKEMGIVLLKTKDLEYPDGFPEWMNDVWLEWQREKKMEEKRKKKGKAKGKTQKGTS